MKQGDLLFVYGTLRVGETADLSKNPSQLSYVGKDYINGKLYNATAWYPGAKLIGADPTMPFETTLPRITGDVFEITDKAVVASLDGYESYPELYGRSQVQTAGGRTVWVYTYKHYLSEDARIPNGDWVYKAPENMETVQSMMTIAASLAGGAAH